MPRCTTATNGTLLFRKLMEAASIRTRPASCFVSAVRLCLKQFHKDHYFLSRDVSEPNEILLRSLLAFCTARGDGSYGPIENELEWNDT